MTKEDYMHLPKERLAQMLAERDSQKEFSRGVYRGWVPQVPSSGKPACYEPGGTCTNPQMDCINCPKKSSSAHVIYKTN